MQLLRLQYLLRQSLARVRAWMAGLGGARRVPAPAIASFIVLPPATIHRDVSANGVRVFSLCGSCGARLEASATLCEDCAQKRSRLG